MVPGIGNAFSAAWQKMKDTLFKPFDWNIWLVLTLGVWLAGLGEGGTGFNLPIRRLPHGEGGVNVFLQPVQSAAETLGTTVTILIVVAGGVLFLIFLTLGLVLLWVRCRSRFVVLDMLIRGPRADAFGARWHGFRRQGNSFFFTQLLLTVTMMFLGICAAGGMILIVMALLGGKGHGDGGSLSAVVLIAVSLLALTLATIGIAVYLTLFQDYGALLMYRSGCSGPDALRALNRKLMERPGTFFCYLAGLFLFSIAISFLLVLFSCITCCIGGIVLMIPFLSTMVLLPLLYVRWQYSIEFFDNPEMLE